jgi:hypothetical protein
VKLQYAFPVSTLLHDNIIEKSSAERTGDFINKTQVSVMGAGIRWGAVLFFGELRMVEIGPLAKLDNIN